MTRSVRLDRLRRSLPTVAVALLAGGAGTLASFLLAGGTPGFVAAPIAGFLARTLPGIVLTAAILLLGSLGDLLNLFTAVGLAVVAFALIAGAGIVVGRAEDQPALGAILAAVTAGGLSLVITGAVVSSAAAGVAVGLVLGVAEASVQVGSPPAAADRRRVLTAVAALIGVGVFGVGARQLGLRAAEASARDRAARAANGGTTTSDGRAQQLLAQAASQSLDVLGLEPLVSDSFYEVDIDAINPDVSTSDWSLAFTGAVAAEKTVGYDALRAMDPDHQFVTLRCVGESLNGEKMDNALWTGVPISRLLDGLDVQSGCGCVMLHAADGYYEEFPLAALRRGFLAWGMNGEDLPRAHGYPLRALIPGHWGEINVKWLTEVEFLDRAAEGYWEQRGWHGTGPVNTVAKLHVVNRLSDGRVQVAGHAYAGTRGIDRVEVSTDGGDSWQPATLSDPLPGVGVWRQWAHTYDSSGSLHTVVVRAVDGTGATQPEDSAGAYPNGPSGWVSRRIGG